MPGFAADRLTDAHHSLLGRNRAQKGASRLCRVTAAERIAQKVKLLFRQLREPTFETDYFGMTRSAVCLGRESKAHDRGCS